MSIPKSAIVLFLLATLVSAGCANYAGLHTQAKLTHVCGMDTQPSCRLPNEDWWKIFHDPQLNCFIAQGLANSPTMKIAEARVRLAQSLTNGANADLWPSISARGIVDREHFSKNWLIPPQVAGKTLNQGYLGLKFNYDFDFWGAHSAEFNAVLSEKQAASAELYAARLLLTTAIANTYFELRSVQLQRAIAKTLLTQQQMMLRITEKRAAAGIESAIQTNTATIGVNTAQLNLENLEEATELATHQLNVLLGKSPCEPKILLTNSQYHQKIIAIPKTIPLNLIGRRPDIVALRWQIEAANYNISTAKARFYPNVNILALAGLLSIGLENLLQSGSAENSLAPAVSLPIFDAGRLRANLSAKCANYDRMVEEYNQAILNALRETADQLSILKVATLHQKMQNTSLKIKQDNYHLICQQYHSGIVDYLTTLQENQSFLGQKIVQIQSQTHYLQSIIATVKSLGGNYQQDDDGNKP